MSTKVLCVAVEGSVGDWTAYIDAVEGESHSVEWQEVKDHGSKLPQEIAEILFPNFKGLRWRA